MNGEIAVLVGQEKRGGMEAIEECLKAFGTRMILTCVVEQCLAVGADEEWIGIEIRVGVGIGIGIGTLEVIGIASTMDRGVLIYDAHVVDVDSIRRT